MALRPPNTLRRERIMSVGAAGMGKSRDFYSIALMALRTKSDAVFYVIDTDESAGANLTESAFADLLDDDYQPKNIDITVAEDWLSLRAAMVDISKEMRPQDWVMIDMLTPAWTWAQEYFTDQIFHQDMDEYMLAIRKQMQDARTKEEEKAVGMKRGGFEGFKDWQFINQVYSVLQVLMLRCPGNLYVTSEVKALRSGDADDETKALFGPHGVQPVGQKATPHKMQTIIWKRQFTPGVWDVTTIKDRGRELMESKVIEDFARQYLMEVAGWRLI